MQPRAEFMEAAGFSVTRQSDRVVASGAETGLSLHITPDAGEGVQRIAFSLISAPHHRTEHQIGRSTLTVGPGPYAEWRLPTR